MQATGRRDDEGGGLTTAAPPTRPAPRWRRWSVALVAAGVSLAAAGCGNGGLPDSATSQGEEVTSLWQLFLILAAAVAALIWILVAVVVVASLRRRRQHRGLTGTAPGGGPGDDGDDGDGDVDADGRGNGGARGRAPIPEQIQYRTRLEIVYTAIPLVLVFVLLGFTFSVDRVLTDTSDQPDLVVEVTGFQWQWQFRYPELGITIAGDPEDPPTLWLPVGRTVRFELQATDVIHSFWVPEFLEKRDMIPGTTNVVEVDVTRTGQWTGRCAEYCGLNHWQMWFGVNAVPADQFDTWATVTARVPQPVIQGRAQVTSTTSSTVVPVTTPPPTVSVPPPALDAPGGTEVAP